MGRVLQTGRSTPPAYADAGARRKTSAAEVEPPQCEESLQKKKKRTISERLILVSQRACWGEWTCGCSRAVRIMMSKGGFVGQ